MPSRKQLALALPNAHGGRRKGAGRPNRSGLPAHLRRPRLTGREPLHVTIKLQPGLPSLRRKDVFRCLKEAVKTARHKGLAIVHYSILSNQVHLLAEAADQNALRRAFQSFGIAFAKRLNALLRRRGSVFLGRYHLHVLRTPNEVRNALRYVVSNEKIHWERGRRSTKPTLYLDGFSSAGEIPAKEWSRLFGASVRRAGRVQGVLAGLLQPSSTWLLRSGWARTCGRTL